MLPVCNAPVVLATKSAASTPVTSRSKVTLYVSADSFVIVADGVVRTMEATDGEWAALIVQVTMVLGPTLPA
jgi:hypothetical protein